MKIKKSEFKKKLTVFFLIGAVMAVELLSRNVSVAKPKDTISAGLISIIEPFNVGSPTGI